METDLSYVVAANKAIFHKINTLFGQPEFHNLIMLVQRLLDSSAVAVYIFFFGLISIFKLYKIKNNRQEFDMFFILSASCFLTFAFSGICFFVALIFKNHADVVRPFCTYHHLYRIEEIVNKLECNKSFPSGHMSLAVAVVASFWPLFNKIAKYLAIGFLILVGIGRIAAGAHYPIDLLGAIIIMLPFVLYMRPKIVKLTESLAKKLKIFNLAYKLFGIKP